MLTEVPRTRCYVSPWSANTTKIGKTLRRIYVAHVKCEGDKGMSSDGRDKLNEDGDGTKLYSKTRTINKFGHPLFHPRRYCQ